MPCRRRSLGVLSANAMPPTIPMMTPTTIPSVAGSVRRDLSEGGKIELGEAKPNCLEPGGRSTERARSRGFTHDDVPRSFAHHQDMESHIDARRCVLELLVKIPQPPSKIAENPDSVGRGSQNSSKA